MAITISGTVTDSRQASANYSATASQTSSSTIITNITPLSAWMNNSSVFNVPHGGTTYSNLLVLWGTGPASSSIPISNNGSSIGTATSDVNGNWSFTTGNSQASTSLIVADGAQSFVAGNSSTYNITINPNVTSFTSTPDATYFTNGIATYNQSAGQPWSIQYNASNHDQRFELRQADHWPSDYSASVQRSENDMHYFQDNVVAYVAFEFMMEAGSPETVGWGDLVWQVQQDNSTGGSLESMTFNTLVNNDMLYFEISTPASSGLATIAGGWNNEFTFGSIPGQAGDKYLSTIVRGHWYTFFGTFKHNNTDGSGFCKFWLDGTQVIDYAGNMGITTSTQTLMCLGNYRDVNTGTNIVHYRNFLVSWPVV